MRVPLLLISALAFFAAPAEARVFNYKDSTLAMFLRGTGGTSNLGDAPFGDSCGTDTEISEGSKYSYSGELGLLIGLGSVNLKLGAEALQHRPVAEGKGKNSSDVERFSLDSSTFVFNPNVAIEIVLDGAGNTRYFASGSVGYAMVDVENRYTMTATGTTDLGVSDFNEKMIGTGMSATLGGGLESLFTDNVTFTLEGGYRYLKVAKLTYRGDVNNIVKPAGASKGEEALNHDGTSRALDLSSFFVGVSFRFYLHFL
jgi:opacity protein-like surface antigen